MSRTIPTGTPEDDRSRVIERPDGFYWRTEDRRSEYGPFPSLMAAITDMQETGDTAYEPGESLAEAESEIGIADWIDPDTGEPAEGGGPHLEDH
ncbi:MAG: hypothetical protein EXR32_04115 [Betaproteobacteria bacterium]|nr:hypothetical protein [Betaproteobacteria bacterium]